jgi:hypothetical protein
MPVAAGDMNAVVGTNVGLKVMVDCLGNSRHMLQWLMDQLDCHKDGIFLSVAKALDQGTGHVRLLACH